MLSDLVPSVFAMQETKRRLSDPPLRASNLINYQVFDHKRELEKKYGGKCLAGGGIAIGALHELKPVLSRKGEDETECLSVEVSVGNEKLIVVACYGPQLGDPKERNISFWKYLAEEADAAKEQNKGLIIQMDTNSWVGPEIIPNDPNKRNANGKLMKQFLKNNPALTVLNSLGYCDGTVTRRRTSTLGEETSVLDVYIVCQKVLKLVKHMQIDHKEQYILSNFRAKRIER